MWIGRKKLLNKKYTCFKLLCIKIEKTNKVIKIIKKILGVFITKTLEYLTLIFPKATVNLAANVCTLNTYIKLV